MDRSSVLHNVRDWLKVLHIHISEEKNLPKKELKNPSCGSLWKENLTACPPQGS